MKIVFRLNYHTVQGQSLWVKISLKSGGTIVEELLSMRWINSDQWQTELELASDFELFRYRYVFRQDSNGVELEEWGGPRTIEPRWPVYIALDTWRSAGTVDYAYQTKAFRAVLDNREPHRAPFEENHLFQLSMAAVPEGQVVCILGNAWELGAWDRNRAVLMQETSPNVWSASVQMSDGFDVHYKYGLYDVRLNRLIEVEQGENRWFYSPKLATEQVTQIKDEAYRRYPHQLFRGAGVAVPIFSLRSKEGLGVGEFSDLKPLAD